MAVRRALWTDRPNEADAAVSVSQPPGVAMDVGEWLRSLGLEQHAPVFRENGIDGRVLPKLTAEDLKDLGISLVGHRRLLLKAIGALHPEPAPATDPPVVS